jgi:hypothetical protein
MIQGYPKPNLMETFKYNYTFVQWVNKLGKKKTYSKIYKNNIPKQH